MKQISSVLFDLDGTLLDTAPDLAYALNQLLAEHQRPKIPLNQFRQIISDGTAAFLKLGFNVTEDDPEFTTLKQRFLALYHQHIARETQPFSGIIEVLNYLKQQEISWGIVTNKVTYLTFELIKACAFAYPPACIVCGDTTAFIKPHPAPLLHACTLLKVQPSECIYIGDSLIDIQASHAAEITALYAQYGYGDHASVKRNYPDTTILNQAQHIITWLTQNHMPSI